MRSSSRSTLRLSKKRESKIGKTTCGSVSARVKEKEETEPVHCYSLDLISQAEKEHREKSSFRERLIQDSFFSNPLFNEIRALESKSQQNNEKTRIAIQLYKSRQQTLSQLNSIISRYALLKAELIEMRGDAVLNSRRSVNIKRAKIDDKVLQLRYLRDREIQGEEEIKRQFNRMNILRKEVV